MGHARQGHLHAGETISVFLEVGDAGLPHNSHAKADGSSKSFVAAEALTVSHYSFVASVPLEGNATYFLESPQEGAPV